VLKADYKTKIISGTEKINKFYITDVRNRIIDWTFDEIIFEDNAIIEFDFSLESKYHLKINSPNIYIGSNVLIKRLIDVRPRHGNSADQGEKGAIGKQGYHNLTTVEFNGDIKYIQNLTIELNGGKGGDGQNGGDGFYTKTKVNGKFKSIVKAISTLTPGGQGGDPGSGGDPGNVILNLSSQDSKMKILSILNKGENGVQGKVGKNP
jgi:hypothetical protein